MKTTAPLVVSIAALLVALGGQLRGGPPPERLVCSRVSVVDPEGRERVVLGFDRKGTPAISILGEDGGQVVQLWGAANKEVFTASLALGGTRKDTTARVYLNATTFARKGGGADAQLQLGSITKGAAGPRGPRDGVATMHGHRIEIVPAVGERNFQAP